MSGSSRRDRAPLVAMAVLVVAVAGFAWLLRSAQALPSGVVPVLWDKEACAHCRMHVGERGFAAQLQLADGRVLTFDDPGCLFSWLSAAPADPLVHAMYFHDRTAERWWTRAEVGFVAAAPTPMGFGWAAVAAATPGAISFDEAATRVRAQARPTAGAP